MTFWGLKNQHMNFMTSQDLCELYLQSVLPYAAQLIMRKRELHHITPTLHNHLHWLPVAQRIIYKLYKLQVSAPDQSATAPRAVSASYS